MSKHLTFLLLIALFGVFLSSCKDDPASPAEEQKPATLKAGSTFSYQVQETDTSWTEITSVDSMRYTILSADSTFEGIAHTIVAGGTDADTNIYALSATGDLLLYQAPIDITLMVLPESWSTLPIASKTANVPGARLDTIVKYQGLNAHIVATRTSGYLGDTTFALNGKTYAVNRVFDRNDVLVVISGQTVFTQVYLEYWYSPELKTFVVTKSKSWSDSDLSPVPDGGTIKTLTRFTL